LLGDITTFNIGFPIPYKLQKAQIGPNAVYVGDIADFKCTKKPELTGKN
jgi:hypothetical protein